jgi:hypothetical protein
MVGLNVGLLLSFSPSPEEYRASQQLPWFDSCRWCWRKETEGETSQEERGGDAPPNIKVTEEEKEEPKNRGV